MRIKTDLTVRVKRANIIQYDQGREPLRTTDRLSDIIKSRFGVELSLSDVVLDCGCGNGVILASLVNPKVRVGIDLPRRNLIEAKRNFKGVFCVVGDVENLPFKQSSFDALIAAALLHHLPNYEQALAEMSRVLKPGGHLFITSEINKTAIGPCLPLISIATFIAHSRGHLAEFHVGGFTLENIYASLEKAGFSVVKEITYRSLVSAFYHLFLSRSESLGRIIYSFDSRLQKHLPKHLKAFFNIMARAS